MALHELIVCMTRGRNVLVVIAALGLCGCAVVGPQSIGGGRAAYTEVINRTEDEQILNVVVRQRYDETFGMMTVASVTANIRFSAQASSDIGLGNSDNYDGNLVPLSAGVAYEENPTVSYVPLSGEDFTRRMLSPVSVNEWVLLSGNTRNPSHLLALAARRINSLRSPLLGQAPVTPEFPRFLELYNQLRRAQVVEIVQADQSGGTDEHLWEIHDYEPAYGATVREFLRLLGIEVPVDGSTIMLPIRQQAGSSVSAVHLHPRSALNVLRSFGAGVEIPRAHLEAGIVEPLTAAIPEDMRFITIRSAEKRPDNATVRVLFRDRWFYIDATDTQSKLAFRFLRTFIGMRLAEARTTQQAPVITLQAN
jgi:hypothetical protein